MSTNWKRTIKQWWEEKKHSPHLGLFFIFIFFCQCGLSPSIFILCEVRDTTAGWRRWKERFGAGHGNAKTEPGYNNATSVELLSRRGQEVAELAPTDRVRRDAREPGRGVPQEETEERPVRPETPWGEFVPKVPLRRNRRRRWINHLSSISWLCTAFSSFNWTPIFGQFRSVSYTS